MDALREIVLPRLERIKKSGGGYMAQCPAHEDRTQSLSVSEGRAQPVVFHCHAGCDPDTILGKLGLTWDALSKPREPEKRRDTADKWVAKYDYVDESGKLLFQVLRSGAKDFRQRRPDPSATDGWSWKLGETRRVLYRLPEIIAQVQAGKMVYICEGEKDVHTLESLGMVATCNSGGAGKWRPEYAEFLREAVVTIVADKDDPGQAHARQVRDSLIAVDAEVEVVEAAAGKDVTDHIKAGYGLDQLVQIWPNPAPPRVDLAVDLWEFIRQADDEYDWIVPGLLERGDRVILTGFEGLGKSMVIRQMATCIAAGIHPFFWDKLFDPQKVLVIDCENSERQSRRKFRALASASIKHARRVPEGNLRLIHRPEGIDLTRQEHADWAMERVVAHQPAVLFIGPFYRLHNANINEELPARKTVAVLDALRAAVNCALITEAHAGHGQPGMSRSVRPAGSSLLLRWPEFGYGLRPAKEPRAGQPVTDVVVQPWRGPREERNWPNYLTYGDPGDWPWKWSPGVAAEEA